MLKIDFRDWLRENRFHCGAISVGQFVPRAVVWCVKGVHRYDSLLSWLFGGGFQF